MCYEVDTNMKYLLASSDCTLDAVSVPWFPVRGEGLFSRVDTLAARWTHGATTPLLISNHVVVDFP